MASDRQGASEDVVRTSCVADWRGWLAPTPADLESPGAGQRHHLVVVRTSGQGLSTLLIRFDTTNQLLQLRDFVKEKKQILFGHDQGPPVLQQ